MSAVIGEAAGRAAADPFQIGRLLDSVDLPIVVVDCDVTVVRFNAAAADLLSLTTSDAGRPLRAVPMLTELTEELHELCERVVGGSPALKRRVRGTNGSWFLVRIIPYLQDGGEAIGAVITVTNVTAVLAGMEQAVIERQHAKMILNTVGTPLLVLGADLAVRTANRAFYASFGLSRDETIGIHISKLAEGQWDLPDLASLLEECLREGKAFEAFEVEREFASTGRKTLLLTARPLPKETGSDPSLLLMIEDVTARRRAEAALRESEQQLNDFFDNAAVGLHWVGPDGTILRANQAELDLLGYTRDEYVGRKIDEFHADRPVVDEILRRLNRGETLSSHPARMRCKDGSIKHVLIDSNVLWGKNGEFIHTRCFTRDVTQAVRAEEALRRRTEQFETLLNEAPLGVYLVDADFRIRHVNPTALPVFGIADLVGRDFGEVMHILWPKPYADEVVQRFRHTLQTGEPYATPERTEKRLDSGVTEYYEWQIHRIPLPDGSYGVVCYFRDISRHVLAKQALEEGDRRKDEFLAMLAHELRNPLAAIGMSAEILKRVPMDDNNARFAVPAIARQTTQLRKLADDLFDTARALHGKLRLQREAVQLLDLAKTVAADYLNQSQQIEVGGDDVCIDADPARVQQMIGNLVQNAFKYGGRNVSIRVSREDRFGRLVIQDDGQGIAPELLPNLFQPFVQGQQSLEREQGGLGLGLALVHRLSALHGGAIEAHSDGPGKGSTFTVYLPLAAKPALQVREGPTVVPSKRRILIIEDQEDARVSLRLLLQADGHEVAAARNGREGLSKLADFRPDIALVDIGLPEFDGYEVARRVRESAAGKGIKLIALTGYGGLADQARAQACGFDMHLTKPVAYDKLALALALRV
ncbi:MAG: PAS domain-containing protein [Chloroflexi bacterium]|nr:PAS domain-containing protein [Chloroflexota bacterium]